MKITTAISLVEELIFWPDWKFTATDHSMRFEDCILVRIDYPAQNTDRTDAREGYPNQITTYATFPIVVGNVATPIALYRKIINAVTRIRIHEDREALRVAPTYWAPFHPHRIDGIDRWDATCDVSDDSRLLDLQFGLG